MSGVISEMGSLAREKSGFQEGDEVMALVGGGGYAGASKDLSPLTLATSFIIVC